MTETQKLLLTFSVILLGSGWGTAIVEAVLKRRFDAQLERLKTILERGSRIHERQVDALLTIHSKLEAANFYFQRATSAIVFAGEVQEELLKKMICELASASAEYSQKKLLFSQTLMAKLDQFLAR